MNGARLRAGKLKVLFFTSSLGGGGAELHLVRLLNHLDQERVHPLLAVARTGGQFESRLAETVERVPLLTRPSSISTLSLLRAVPALRAALRREQPDLVCSVLDHANVAAVLAARGLPKRSRHVLCVQNPLSSKYLHSLRPARRIRFLLIRGFYPRADCIVTPTQGVAEDLWRLLPGLRNRTTVIYNAAVDAHVRAAALEPLLEQPVPKRPLVVACGRLVAQKGYGDLLEAIALAQRTRPVSLWIIGEGKLRARLEHQASVLGLTGQVRFLGFQDNPYKFIAAADVFALSSLFEGFGNVLVEAMACGAPVVATDCPYGPGELIVHGVNGLLVPPRDPAALAAALLRVLEDETVRTTLVRNGRQRSEAFEARSVAAAYLELFEQMA